MKHLSEVMDAAAKMDPVNLALLILGGVCAGVIWLAFHAIKQSKRSQ